MEDLEKIDKIVSQQTGMKSHFIRFPGGSSNLVSKIDMQILIDEINDVSSQIIGDILIDTFGDEVFVLEQYENALKDAMK